VCARGGRAIKVGKEGGQDDSDTGGGGGMMGHMGGKVRGKQGHMVVLVEAGGHSMG